MMWLSTKSSLREPRLSGSEFKVGASNAIGRGVISCAVSSFASRIFMCPNKNNVVQISGISVSMDGLI